MDKVHCNIIQDLLPLYADDVVSPESKAMVDTHLANCSECREILDEIRSSISVPQHSDTSLFKKIKRKQQIKSVALAVVIVLFFYAIIGAPVVAYIKDSFVEYNAEDCIVSESQDGSPIIEMSDRAKGANIYYLYDVDESGNTEVYICIDSNRRSAVYDFISRLYKLDFSGDSIYVTPTLGISEQAQNYSNFPGVQALLFDETVTAIYYLPITTEQQTDFYANYLSIFSNGQSLEVLIDYEIPNISQRVELWTNTDAYNAQAETTEDTNEVPGRTRFIVEIRDRAEEEQLVCAEAEELFYEDETTYYWFNVIKSHYIIVTYSNGNSEDVKTALNAGRVTIADLDEFDIEYKTEPKE